MNTTVSLELRQKIQTWKKNLAELTKRNRLLYFYPDKKPTTEIKISASQLFEKLVIKSVAIPAIELDAAAIEAQIMALAYLTC
jgi:hypothetical protein